MANQKGKQRQPHHEKKIGRPLRGKREPLNRTPTLFFGGPNL